MKGSKRAATLGIFAIAGAGCSAPAPGAVIHLDDLPRLVAIEELRIGDLDDPGAGFSRISAMDVDRDGNLYVVEASVPEIRVFDPAGAIIRRIGRRGEGPGEFTAAPRFGVHGDTVWTVEGRGSRMTHFDRRGRVLATGRTDGVSVHLPTGVGGVIPWAMRPDGQFTGYLGRITYTRNASPSGVLPTDSIPVPFVLFDVTGTVTDTIGWSGRPPPRMWRPPSEESANAGTIDVGGRQFFVPNPPTTLPWWEAREDGYVSVETPLAPTSGEGIVRVTRIGTAADTLFSNILHYRPAPYTGPDLDSIAARAARGEEGGFVPFFVGADAPPPPSNWEAIAHALRGAMDFPEFQLPLSYPWVAQDGSVWLRLSIRPGEPQRWIVLDAKGRARGLIDLPDEARVAWHRGDRFWAAIPDEFGVPWAVQYRIEEG